MIYNIETLWLRRTVLIVSIPFIVTFDAVLAIAESFTQNSTAIVNCWRKR